MNKKIYYLIQAIKWRYRLFISHYVCKYRMLKNNPEFYPAIRGKKNNEELNFKKEEFHNAVRALDALIRYLNECENVYPEPHYGFEKCIELAKKARGHVSKLYG